MQPLLLHALISTAVQSKGNIEAMPSVSCPALFLTAPASGEGKTTITAALARLLTRQGKSVRIFKTGPDYLDPQILEQACGLSVVQLDIWMAGEAWCQHQLYLAAQSADLIIIEGAMGMFDGEPSSADLAARFNIPMAIILDVKGMAQTAAAVAVGLANYRDDIEVAGLIANYCASDRHRQLIEDALPENLPLIACLNRSEQVALPERHLGLVQAQEVKEELELRLEAGADWLATAGMEKVLAAISAVNFYPSVLAPLQPLLENMTIAVAKDTAFSFIYAANVQLLRDMGAVIVYFSPLYDLAIPEADALWLPGGYPELHSKTLSENRTMLTAINDFYLADKAILAECGGFLYTLTSLENMSGSEYPMAGLITGKGIMRERGGCQGMQTAILPEGEVRAHAHHRSASSGTIAPISYGRRQRHVAPGEPIYRKRGLTASYLHLFFPSNPEAVAALFLSKVGLQAPQEVTL